MRRRTRALADAAETTGGRSVWTSQRGFLFAAIGSAVGLGSIWKFPYMAGENGGGAFVLVYLVAVVLLTLPLLVAEFVIGRAGGGSAVASFARAARRAGASGFWGLAGAWGIAGGLLVLSFYSVIGGWTLAYVPLSLGGAFTGLDAAGIGGQFAGFLADPVALALWHGVFMALTAGIVMAGVAAGLERAVTVLMPLLLLLMLGLVAYAAATAGLGPALRFLFAADLAKLSPANVLAAIGLAFFSIGVGFGVMVTYAAYAGREVDLTRVAVLTVAGDTLVSLLAGLAIFPLVLAYDLDAGQGPGLMFATLPIAFGQMPAGALVGALFFLLLFISALASAISLLELAVAFLVERGMGRVAAAAAAGLGCFLAGLVTVASFNVWREVRLFEGVAGLGDKSLFELLDHLTSNIMLPVGGLLIAVFVGYVMRPRAVMEALEPVGGVAARLFLGLVRVAVPLAILAILVTGLGAEGAGGG